MIEGFGEGSGSVPVPLTKDPDPGGLKTYGFTTLLEKIFCRKLIWCKLIKFVN
jgi:hypothetical protein